MRHNLASVLSLCLITLMIGAPDCAGQDIDYSMILTDGGQPSSLRLLTINVWSGLDYEGFFRFGEYETGERRQARFQSLVSQIQRLEPDVVFVQEANPLGRYASRLADHLSFDEIHQVVNAGVKFGPLGIPTNFKEGLAILARPSLRIEKFDAWKLSGPFGLHGDVLSIHFGEAVLSLVGKIFVDDTPVYVVNVHLVAAPPPGSEIEEKLQDFLSEGSMTEKEYRRTRKYWHNLTNRRKQDVEKLLERLRELPQESPVIVAGDFNATPDSPEIQLFQTSGRFLDSQSHSESVQQPTWVPGDNENVSFSSRMTNARGNPRKGYGRLFAWYAGHTRRVDYVFLSRHFQAEDISASGVVLDSPVGGVRASDHYGVLAEVNLQHVLRMAPKEPQVVTPLTRATFEPLPILMYSTDIGFGYGAKFFLLNSLRRNESFDALIFFSTGVDTVEGERRYRFVFSKPDFDRRQGKVYPLAFDLLIDYDIWINNSFFGIGNGSDFDDREYYTREPFEVSLALSRGFSPRTVGQVGYRYKTVKNFNFASDSRLARLPGLSRSRVTYASLFATYRYDTRDIFTNPSRGLVVQGEVEYAPDTGLSNVAFTRVATWLQYYSILFYPHTVFAFRLGGQALVGSDLPVQVLLPIGGSITMRGYPRDRYLDKVSAVSNAELRFPLFWHLGGVVGVDAGKVWHRPDEIDFSGWAVNTVVGLRYYMQTYVVRIDIGFGPEATGLYFNFGHVF